MDIWIDLSKYSGKVRKCLSASVQKHAFVMGIYWFSGANIIMYTDKPYIILFKGYDEPCLFYGEEYGKDDELISVENFLDMKTSPFTKNKQKQNNIVYADFSWVKGMSRTVLIERCLQIARCKDYKYKSFTKEFGRSRDIDRYCNFPYLFIDKQTKCIHLCNDAPKNAKEIKCNDMLVGKY